MWLKASYWQRRQCKLDQPTLRSSTIAIGQDQLLSHYSLHQCGFLLQPLPPPTALCHYLTIFEVV